MLKKIILSVGLFVLISAAIVFPFIANTSAHALEKEDATVKSYILLEYDSGQVLKEYNADERRPIASMVKIMTLLLTFEAIEEGRLDYDRKIQISEAAAGMGGSQMFLEAYDEYTVSDLIKGVTVCSANDAAAALGETISGSIPDFIALMNNYSVNIGLKNTLFCNTTGLPGGEQYSTARDVSTLMRKLLTHKEYYKFSTVWMENYNHPDGRVTELVNTNKLIRFYMGCDAGKTGFTNDAMFCLSASAIRKDMRVIATVLGAETSKDRFRAVSDLFNFAFAQYEQAVIIRKGEKIPAEIRIEKSKSENISVYAETDLKIFTKKGDREEFEVKFELYPDLSAPISAHTPIGRLYLQSKSGEVLSETKLITENDIEKLGFSDALRKVLEKWGLKSKKR